MVRQGQIDEGKQYVSRIQQHNQDLLVTQGLSIYESMVVDRLCEICEDITNVAMFTLKQRHRQQLKREKARRQHIRAQEDRLLWQQCGIEWEGHV